MISLYVLPAGLTHVTCTNGPPPLWPLVEMDQWGASGQTRGQGERGVGDI